jgi:hypothetical protein
MCGAARKVRVAEARPQLDTLIAVLCCREMLNSTEPNVSLAQSLVLAVKADDCSAALLDDLTHWVMSVDDERGLRIARQRLTQSNPQHPLWSLSIDDFKLAPQLFPALSSTTTLTAVHYGAAVPSDLAAQLLPLLKSIPSLGRADVRFLPIDAAIDLLQSRTDWHCILLPDDDVSDADIAKAAGVGALNRVDFELTLTVPDTKPLSFDSWLSNPHLSELIVFSQKLPVSWFNALHLHNRLTHMVLSCVLRCIDYSLGFVDLPVRALVIRRCTAATFCLGVVSHVLWCLYKCIVCQWSWPKTCWLHAANELCKALLAAPSTTVRWLLWLESW